MDYMLAAWILSGGLILSFMAALSVSLVYLYDRDSKKEMRRRREEERKPRSFIGVAEDTREKYFDRLYKELLRDGSIKRLDKEYMSMRRRLHAEAEGTAQEYKDGNPSFLEQEPECVIRRA